MIEFSGYKWRTSQPWGDYHPNSPFWWYDSECVDVTDGTLRLQTKRHERKINGVTNRIGVGLVSGDQDIKYGLLASSYKPSCSLIANHSLRVIIIPFDINI